MTTLAPPQIADLEWTEGGVARVTDAYWELHRPGKLHLRKAGLRVERSASGRWFVRFDPDTTTPEAMTAGIAAAREARIARDISTSDWQRDRDEREAERRRRWEEERPAREAERKRQLERVEQHRRERVLEVQKMGRETLERWGEFAERKAKLRELVDAVDLDPFGVMTIIKIVRATDRKATLRRATASRQIDDASVDWSDKIVASAIEILTQSDGDRAAVRNSSGWSSSDSSTGHWCAAMLRTGDAEEKALAIKSGRGLVGKYAGQLRAAGLSV